MAAGNRQTDEHQCSAMQGISRHRLYDMCMEVWAAYAPARRNLWARFTRVEAESSGQESRHAACSS
eukprot:5531739-Pleurochrysis_carterae.AAC.1